ncbi:MAG: hypothetical protein KGD67_04385 [Candidatus Lokiarchaeota archaeon]|nr:hypothetical protein [Candidatus Lokiarchaeota archaeon]
MSCIHGLDNNNCPICRISKSTIPNTTIAKNVVKIENLRPENQFFKNHLENKKESEKNLTKTNTLLNPNLINPLPVPNLINKLPTFENKDFVKKLDDLNLSGLDPHGISKKINLESPKVKLDEE